MLVCVYKVYSPQKHPGQKFLVEIPLVSKQVQTMHHDYKPLSLLKIINPTRSLNARAKVTELLLVRETHRCLCNDKPSKEKTEAEECTWYSSFL